MRLMNLYRYLRLMAVSRNRQYHSLIADPRINKGLGFTYEERQLLGIHGLLPPAVRTMDEQVLFCKLTVLGYKNPLSQYVYLTELGDRNEKLFYRLVIENIQRLMPILYTPTVGLACQKFGMLFRRPRGLFINIHDKGHIEEVLKNWPERDIKVIVVTDGQRILGLGDLGANGMGIPVGKLSLYIGLARIPPRHTLPIVLDVGTTNKQLQEDPLYIGLREPRVTGQIYEEFVDEFMTACVNLYGPNVCIQFEDFAFENARKFLQKYRDKYCTFNDDIQGTASIGLAGLLAATKLTGKKLSENTILFFGAGGASTGIANLTVMAMEREGMAAEEARKRIWMMDRLGVLTKSRPKENTTPLKNLYAKDHAPSTDLLALIKEIKPNALIGAGATGGVFTPEILKAMAENTKRPIVFALSNPTQKAECTPQQAYDHTNGTVIFSSGSPFDPVTFGGKQYHTGQGNNCYIFPGVGLGVILAGMQHIPEEIFLIAADVVANNVTQADLDVGRIYPPISAIGDVSIKIATAIIEYALKKNVAAIVEPKNITEYIKSHQYNYMYSPGLPNTWPGPKTHKNYDLQKWKPPDYISC